MWPGPEGGGAGAMQGGAQTAVSDSAQTAMQECAQTTVQVTSFHIYYPRIIIKDLETTSNTADFTLQDL